MQMLEERRFSENHLWVQQETQGLRIGISHWGCEYLGAIDYVELPAPGQPVIQDSPFGWVETSKAVTELLAPVSGTAVEVNEEAKESPRIITEDPYGRGWLIVVSPSNLSELDRLLSPDAYAKFMSEKE